MSNIKKEMPVLVRHEGDWKGIYTVVNTEGEIIDKYESHLSCQFPEKEDYPYYQTNRYSWADGKKEEYGFPGKYEDKKLIFDTERIFGKAWEVDDSTIILWFSYKGVSNAHVYEMINISPCNNYRCRTWHWFKDNQVFQRTLIQEERYNG